VCGEEIVATLDGTQALGGLAGGESDEYGIESSGDESGSSRIGITPSDSGIGNYGTTRSEIYFGAFSSEAGQETLVDFDGIAAVAKRYGDDAHGGRILGKFQVPSSKFLDQWIFGSMDSWINGFLDQWILGLMD
jgi:hypothetical protein